MAIRSLKTGQFSRSALVGNPVIMPGSYESIATITGNGSSPTITFSNIPSTYTHLQVRISAMQNLGNDFRGVTLRFNGDSGTNYSAHEMGGDGSTTYSAQIGNGTALYPVTAGWSNNNFPSAGIIDILDYASTNKNKTIRSLHGIERNTSPSAIAFNSGVWLSTSAVTSIAFTVNADFYTTATTFALYGVN